jgi:azurin
MSRLLLLLCFFLLSRAVAAEPFAIRIKTLQAQMRYDVAEFTVPPGTPVKIILENVDDMPHNLVLFQAGTDVVAAANQQLEKPELALKREWLPDDPRILAHSKMVQPKATGTFTFIAPDQSGTYPYVCTFPGHALTMQGKMHVASPAPGFTTLTYSVYLGDWQKLPDFSALKPHREGEVPDRRVQLDFDDYKNQFGVVFIGTLDVPKLATYTFHLASDDGARLYVDGKEVIENDGIRTAGSIRTGRIKLEPGERKVRLEYFQAAGEADLFLAWEGPGLSATPLSRWVPGKFKNKDKKDGPPPMPITVGNEPVIYRNFISAAGTRGIGVGYPGGFNVAWSAAHMNLALVWRGAFIDAGRHWTSRGGGAQAPLGFDVFRPGSDLAPPLAVLPSPTEPWPPGKPEEQSPGFAWRGYTLDARRFPTFHWEWNGVKVTERYETRGDALAGDGKLVRTLHLSGPIPSNTYFRAATADRVQPADGGYLLKDAPLHLEGRGFENTWTVAVEGAQVAIRHVLVPARERIEVTYGWPGGHTHHH